ncbi:MAG: fructokinase [Myxococcales bacterium]|nr:fructokinase [Myxococcales bacterium]
MTAGLLRIGVDLGGTKTEAVVVRLGGPDPEVLARRRIPTARDLGYEHIVEQTRALVADVAHEAGISSVTSTDLGIGVGMPGSVTTRTAGGGTSDVALVKNSNTTCLNGRPFRIDLAKALGRTDVAFANDANCFALAEAVWGAARGARVAFGVIMGTGVGGGVVIHDEATALAPIGRTRAWDGAQGIAGEWGHVSLEPVTGPPCYCGRRGCIETYLSGPSIERDYAARSGATKRLAEIAELSIEGDKVAVALLEERVEIFGRALSIVIDVLDPDVIVLGGGVSNLALFYDEGVRAVGRWVFNDELRTRIVKNELGDSAGVLGAALLEPALSSIR